MKRPFEALAAEAAKALRNREPAFKTLIPKVGPCLLRPKNRCTPYQALVESVTYQQLNGRAAQTILNRFKALYPGLSFPVPEQIIATPDETLRSAGLSRAKTAAIKDIAAKAVADLVPSRQAIRHWTDDAIRERLTVIRGVGTWTVDMLLIFTLGRPDVMPATDYGVRQGYARAFSRDLPSPRQLEQHSQAWRPYRSFAAWYLWRALELPPE